MDRSSRRNKDHPEHAEWLARMADYNRQRRKKIKEAKIEAGEEVKQVGRPAYDICICPNCGSEHLDKPGPTTEILRRKWYQDSKKKQKQLPIKWNKKQTVEVIVDPDPRWVVGPIH